MTGYKHYRIIDKRPYPHSQVPREHYVKKNGAWKPKMVFLSEDKAVDYISAHCLADSYTIYKCTICGKFHIGHKIF